MKAWRRESLPHGRNTQRRRGRRRMARKQTRYVEAEFSRLFRTFSATKTREVLDCYRECLFQ